MLCNSHNHSGPDLKELMGAIAGGEQERLARYGRQLTDRLERVVNQALAARTPGRLALARGQVGFAVNRRVLQDGKWTGFGAVPEAPADHSLPVLKVTRADGSLMALVANYACHNTTLRGDFPQIHGDWAGCAQQCIEADHPGALALISIGCGADSDPCPHGTVALCEQHGRELADEVRRLVAGSWTPISPTLTAQRQTLEIAWSQHPEMDRAREMAKQSWAIQAAVARLDQGQPLPVARSYQIVTWAFGNDLAMVFLSDEVVVDYALRLQRELDASRLWITAYAHDVSTYMVSQRLIDEGGYEVQNSLSNLVTFGRPETLQPAMDDRIIGAVKEMLPQTFQQPRAATQPLDQIASASSRGETPVASCVSNRQGWSALLPPAIGHVRLLCLWRGAVGVLICGRWVGVTLGGWGVRIGLLVPRLGLAGDWSLAGDWGLAVARLRQPACRSPTVAGRFLDVILDCVHILRDVLFQFVGPLLIDREMGTPALPVELENTGRDQPAHDHQGQGDTEATGNHALQRPRQAGSRCGDELLS